MKKLKHTLILCITTLLLVACGKKEDSLSLTVTSQSEVTSEETKQSESDILSQEVNTLETSVSSDTDKEGGLLPISDLQLGMTLEDVKKSEPDIKDMSQEAGMDCYSIEKEYCGLSVVIMVFFEDGKVSSIIGNADPGLDVDRAIQSFEEYCNKRYTVDEDEEDEEAETSDMELKTKKWNIDKGNIYLIIFKVEEENNFSFLVSVD